MKKRESFNSRWGFILACIGSAVGMGNIWMFPTRVSLYGGGSFLIPGPLTPSAWPVKPNADEGWAKHWAGYR